MEEIRIKSKDKILAVIIPNSYDKPGLNFITDPKCSFQIACINYPAAQVIERHIHPKFERKIRETIECFFVKKGRLLISFYDDQKKHVNDYTVNEGEMVLLLSGGHSLQYLEPTQLIEVRQGPYNNKMDKIKF